jgi:hypothetical protein
MTPEGLPLSPEDRAILALECDTIVGHTCKVIVAAPEAPDVDALREAVGSRLDRAPELTRRLSEDATGWVPDAEFDIARHVAEVPVERPLDDAGLRAAVAKLFEQRLDRERPLWHLDVARLEGGGAALVWRIHHAVADGTTAMRFARDVLWDPLNGGRAHPRHAAHREADAERRRGHLAGFLRREFARSRERSPFDAAIGRRREVGFATAPLGELHDAAKRLGDATMNDAVLAVVAGGLRRWLGAEHETLADLRVKVPVSLHHEGDDAGNRDSFFAISLPVGEPDAAARLRAVHRQTQVRKADRDAEELDQLLRGLGHVSRRLERLCDKLEHSPRRFALNVSNVPGPPARVGVLGAPVIELHSLAEVGERHALRAAVISYDGRLCFGFCADPDVVDDLDVLVGAVEAEAAELIAAA